MKTISIAIPALHRPDLTRRCIESIERQSLPASEWEVVVIENQARSESILPDPLPLNTTRIELPTNEGTTGSINRAVAATSSKHVLLLNNDIELEPEYLERLVAALEADAARGFAIGKMLRATQRTHLDGAGDAMLVAGGAYRLGSHDRDQGQFEKEKPVLAGCGAAVLYRREVFEKCGGLDPDFFAYLDDIDLGLRAQLLGYGGVYVPQAIAYHIGSATLGAPVHPRILEYVTRNQFLVLAKDYPAPVRRRFLWCITVFQALWFAYAVRHGGLAAYIRGLRQAIAMRDTMRQKSRELLQKRRISDEEFEQLLRRSEKQIFDWHASRDPAVRSSLLSLYFRVCGQR